MGTADKTSKKWVILGSIIIVVALLIAVGPIMVTKYMRAKWQNVPKHRTTNLLMKVEGTMLFSATQNVPFLAGKNGLYYLLENLSQEDINNYSNKNCFVLGKISSPTEGAKIEGNDVRMIISVDKISETGDNFVDENKDAAEKIKEKAAKKNKLRIETNMVLNKTVLFDVIKGKLSLQNRKKKDGTEVSALVLTDEFGDNYLLVSRGKLINKMISDDEIICLGREVMPLKDMMLVVDEVNFEIYEAYDLNYNKIK